MGEIKWFGEQQYDQDFSYSGVQVPDAISTPLLKILQNDIHRVQVQAKKNHLSP